MRESIARFYNSPTRNTRNVSDRTIQSETWINFNTSLQCAGFIKLVWVDHVSGERFIWCGEIYRFISIWDPAPATLSRVEIPEKFILTDKV